MKKFLVIIPAFQSRSYIESTLESIGIAACKAENCKVHVHIQDAGSDQASTYSQKYLVEKFCFQPISYSDLLSCGNIMQHTVSKANHPDTGMYDGLTKAFLTFRLRDFDWITWIGSDDTLSETCFIRVETISNYHPWVKVILSCVGIKDELGNVIEIANRRSSQLTISNGMHNLKVLPPIQQEGSFIRSDFFRQIIKDLPLADYKLAGDWNLWRLCAKHTNPVTVKDDPLGYFHKRINQLSSNKQGYIEEIYDNLSAKMQQALLLSEDIQNSECLLLDFNKHSLYSMPQITKHPLREDLKEINKAANASSTYVKIGNWKNTISASEISIKDSTIVFDKYWQEPAKTELHAKEMITSCRLNLQHVIYLAFPWATFIDKVNRLGSCENDRVLDELLDALATIRRLVNQKYKHKKIITVCQHIHFKKYHHLFEDLNISHVFWAHKIIDEDKIGTIHIHAFPLYPVNTASYEDVDLDLLNSKKYLFSFIGAKANKWYLTDSRNLIFKYYESRSDVLVTSREKWHFQSNVYDQQILNNNFVSETLQMQNTLSDETQQFLQALRQSAFSLCPSGSGPNSIRLWESLESNIVPVVLADTYDPPGLYSLWSQSSLFIEESEESIKKIDSILKNVDEIRYQKFAIGMKQIVYDYGKENFVTDILRLIINIELGGLQCVNPSGDKRPTMKLSSSRTASVESSIIARLSALVSNKGCELFPSQTLVNPIKVDNQLKLGLQLPSFFSSQLPYKINTKKDISSNVVKERVKYFLAGKHSHRTPLSYCNFQSSLLEQGIERTLDINDADYIVTGFSADLPELIKDSKFKNKPILIISEEPLWDITWSKAVNLSQPIQEQLFDNTSTKYLHLNHFNSDIFDFNLIPYFLLTDSRYIARYLLSFQQILKLSKHEILEHWNKLPQNIAFIQEKRLDPQHEYLFDQTRPIKLSKFRTELAMNVNMENVYVEGKGWPSKSHDSDQSIRQEIPDWHLDKLSKLNRKFRFVSAIENIHHPNYVTEKIFDAYATMSVPIFYANNDHYIWKLSKQSSFVNLYGMSVDESARALETFCPTIDFVERYMADIEYILKIFSSISVLMTETDNMASRIRNHLDQALQI